MSKKESNPAPPIGNKPPPPPNPPKIGTITNYKVKKVINIKDLEPPYEVKGQYDVNEVLLQLIHNLDERIKTLELQVIKLTPKPY